MHLKSARMCLTHCQIMTFGKKRSVQIRLQVNQVCICMLNTRLTNDLPHKITHYLSLVYDKMLKQEPPRYASWSLNPFCSIKESTNQLKIINIIFTDLYAAYSVLKIHPYELHSVLFTWSAFTNYTPPFLTSLFTSEGLHTHVTKCDAPGAPWVIENNSATTWRSYMK